MVKKLCNVLLCIIIGTMVLIAGALLAPYLFGYQPLAVLSGSMEPDYPVGSILYVNKSIKPDELKVGDVITFSLDDQTVATHRLVQIDEAKQEFVTKGDANDTADGARSFDTLIGRASTFAVPYLGYISQNIRTPKGIVTAIGAVLVIFLLIFLPDVLQPTKKEEETETSDLLQKETEVSSK